MKLKVANIIEDGRFMGPQRRIYNVAVALDEYIDTHVFLPESDGSFLKILEENNIKNRVFPFVTLSLKRRSSLILYLVLFLINVIRLRYLLKEGGYSTFHFSGGYWQIVGLVASIGLPGTKVWHLNDSCCPKICQPVIKFLSKFVDKIIFTSQQSRKAYAFIESSEAEKIVIPTLIGDEFYHAAQFNIDGAAKIGFLGAINANKRPDYFCKLSNKKQDEHAEFFLAGPVFPTQQKFFEGSCSSLINANSKLHFLGRVDALVFLNSIDVLVCCSEYESGPQVVIEGLATGCYVVTTDCGYVADYIENGKSGTVADLSEFDSILSELIQSIDILREARLKRREENLDVIKKFQAKKHIKHMYQRAYGLIQ
ncbi:glycosyltransferase [Planktomarina temperata]|nr:glycosyltransferase [Planktomarina temperata]